MSTNLPPIGAKVRATRTLNGTTVTVEGVITSAYGGDYGVDPNRPPTMVLAGNEHVSLADTAVQEGVWLHSVEVLSKPEPESGTWVHVRNKDGMGFGHVFCRDDVRRTEQKCGEADEYRWWWYGNGSWENWAYVQGLGNVEVLKAVAA